MYIYIYIYVYICVRVLGFACVRHDDYLKCVSAYARLSFMRINFVRFLINISRPRTCVRVCEKIAA